MNVTDSLPVNYAAERVATAHVDIALAARLIVDPEMDLADARAVLQRLTVERTFLTAHLSTVADQVARLPVTEQAEALARDLRPLTLAVESAAIALARLRRAIAEIETKTGAAR